MTFNSISSLMRAMNMCKRIRPSIPHLVDAVWLINLASGGILFLGVGNERYIYLRWDPEIVCRFQFVLVDQKDVNLVMDDYGEPTCFSF